MKIVAIREAENRLSETLATVKHDEEHTVIQHGSPVTCAVPAPRRGNAAAATNAAAFAPPTRDRCHPTTSIAGRLRKVATDAFRRR
jgi:antitoxin (DNA-binding transcriptional repressor) of toxin-antitoxin stability system